MLRTATVVETCSSLDSDRFVCGAGLCELTCCSQLQLTLARAAEFGLQDEQALEGARQHSGFGATPLQQQPSAPSPVTQAQSGHPHWASTTPGSNAYVKTARKAATRVRATEKPNMAKEILLAT